MVSGRHLLVGDHRRQEWHSRKASSCHTPSQQLSTQAYDVTKYERPGSWKGKGISEQPCNHTGRKDNWYHPFLAKTVMAQSCIGRLIQGILVPHSSTGTRADRADKDKGLAVAKETLKDRVTQLDGKTLANEYRVFPVKESRAVFMGPQRSRWRCPKRDGDGLGQIEVRSLLWR
ncbi:hypothetical protein Q3G72_002992 [Acer saccharum]|nr:hypothetical protein Q3G72_002992 [Acer saccharum]